MPWDILNLALRPFRLAVRPKVGLVLKGSVDEVREAARRIKLVRINGVEIIGLDPPNNPSCAFLTDMRTLRFARLFARRLTDLESLQSLKELRRLAIEHTAKGQSIPIDFRSLPALESAALEWFQGAESIFGASNLRSADLAYYPAASSSSFVKLRHLERLRLAACALTEIEALGQIPSLTWLAPLRLDKLENFSGLSAHPALRFLWIEGCPKLRSLEWLAGMEALETLRILDCGEISGTGVFDDYRACVTFTSTARSKWWPRTCHFCAICPTSKVSRSKDCQAAKPSTGKGVTGHTVSCDPI